MIVLLIVRIKNGWIIKQKWCLLLLIEEEISSANYSMTNGLKPEFLNPVLVDWTKDVNPDR